MLKQSLARGIFLGVVALIFAVNALRYPVGELARAGPGLFPLIVSGLLLLLAALTIVQSRLEASQPLSFDLKNIALIMVSLVLFVVTSELVNMAAAIVVLVFVAGIAAADYSWKRSLKIAAALVLVAFAFQRLLGLDLRLM